MKPLFTLSLFFWVALNSFAQTPTPPLKHQFRLGGGIIFTGSGDIFGGTFRNEYEYSLKRRLSVAASLNFGRVARESRGLNPASPKTYRRIKSINTLDLNMMLGVIDIEHFKFKIGGGFSIKSQLDNDPRYVGFRSVPANVDPSLEIIDYAYQTDMRTISVGWTVPVSVEIHLDRWMCHFRPAIYSFLDGEINTSAILGVGYKF
jgi:hypothetical protein